jgi:hypothetical protein
MFFFVASKHFLPNTSTLLKSVAHQPQVELRRNSIKPICSPAHPGCWIVAPLWPRTVLLLEWVLVLLLAAVVRDPLSDDRRAPRCPLVTG